MALSLYDASIPGYLRMLKALAAMLDKAEAHAREAGKDPDAYVQARLAPDMGDLAKQIQFASDAAKGAAARLAGQSPPAFADTETTMAELKERVAKTIAFVETIRREDVDGHEDRAIEVPIPNALLGFTVPEFLFGFSLPNFHFHVTTAYGLLRQLGVPLGKMDYLAGAPMKMTPVQPS